MADITIRALYGSVVEDDGHLFVGFAEGEDEDEGYILFRQPLGGGLLEQQPRDPQDQAHRALDGGQQADAAGEGECCVGVVHRRPLGRRRE